MLVSQLNNVLRAKIRNISVTLSEIQALIFFDFNFDEVLRHQFLKLKLFYEPGVASER